MGVSASVKHLHFNPQISSYLIVFHTVTQLFSVVYTKFNELKPNFSCTALGICTVFTCPLVVMDGGWWKPEYVKPWVSEGCCSEWLNDYMHCERSSHLQCIAACMTDV